MKSQSLRIGIGLCVAFLLLIVSQAQADENSDRRLISVSGTAELKVDPEQVIFNLGIKTFNKNSDIAKAELDIIAAKIFQAANRYGIKTEDVKTGMIVVQPVYDEPWRNKGFKGFSVQKDLTLTLEDIDRYESFLNELIMPEKIYIYSVNFELKNPAEYRNRARLAAIDAAQVKAREMCNKLGCVLGKPFRVADESNDPVINPWESRFGYQPSPFNKSVSIAGNGQGDSSEMTLGKISVSARVTISFDFE